MNIHELTDDLREGPVVPMIKADAIETILNGAAATRRRRGRLAVTAAVAAIAVTVAVIVGGSTLLGRRSTPGPAPVAPSTVTTTLTTGVTRTATVVTTAPALPVNSAAIRSAATTAATGSTGTKAVTSSEIRVTRAGSTTPIADTSTAGRTDESIAATHSGAGPTTHSGQSQQVTGSAETASSQASNVGHGVLHLTSFRLPSGNIGCRMTTGVHGPLAACAIGQFDGSSCQAGWDHELTIDMHGASFCHAGPEVAVPAGPVLKYGQANVVDGIVCSSHQNTGLTCSSPYDGVSFWVSRTVIGMQPGEGGGQAVHLPPASGRPPVVPITGSATYFGSSDLSVLCKVWLVDGSNASIYCTPNRAGTSITPDCRASGQGAQLDLIDAGVASTHFCGVPMSGAGLPAVMSALSGKIVGGTSFTINQGTCVAHPARVVCQSDGSGFEMSASGYAELGTGSDAPPTGSP